MNSKDSPGSERQDGKWPALIKPGKAEQAMQEMV